MAKHSFFGGSASGLISGANFSNAGYNIFGIFDSDETADVYIEPSNQVSANIDTPNFSTIGSFSQPLNNAKAGSGIWQQNEGGSNTQVSSFLGGVNNGTRPDNSKRYYYIGCINYNIYNLSTVPEDNTIPGSNVDGMADSANNGGATTYETAGDVGGGTQDYTVCLLSSDVSGQADVERQATRITYRFANGALGAGLSALAYYYTLDGSYGMAIGAANNDELSAGKWLSTGYGILQGAEPVFWDNAN